MDETTLRRKKRTEYIDSFLSELGVARRAFAGSTGKCLDDWARQIQLVEAQPSANWGNVILNLCRAVESELAHSLGRIQGLDFMRGKKAIGSKVQSLRGFKPDTEVRQRLSNQGIKPDFVFSALPNLMSSLAAVRSKTDSAHGGVEIGTATLKDAQEARQLAGKILKGVVSKKPGESK